MTPWQCRDARQLLKWSQDELSGASRVPAEIVAMFEEGKLVDLMDLQAKMRVTLEAVGIAFPFTIERGQFMPAAVVSSPPDRQRGH